MVGYAWRTYASGTPGSASREAFARLVAGRADAFAPIDRLRTPEDQGEALAQLSHLVSWEEREDLLPIVNRRGVEVAPRTFLSVAVSEHLKREDLEGALALCRRLLAEHPEDVWVRRTLAELLTDAGRAEEALGVLDRHEHTAPELAVPRAEALVELGRAREALLLLDRTREDLERTQRHAILGGDWQAAQRLLDRVQARADELRAELLGQESVVMAALHQRRMDPHAAVNHRLVGQTLMARSSRVAGRLELQAVQDDEGQEARRALARRPHIPDVLCRLGADRLRLGDLALARELFEAARARDGEYFPATLGLGAVIALRKGDGLRALEDLPQDLEPDLAEALAPILPDLPVLTALERRVVAASAGPLRAALPALASAGVVVRLLPLDVRPTDLPELGRLEHRRDAEDHRALSGIGGLATAGLAVSRVEDLLDTVSDNAWVFAHELAHVAFWALSEPWTSRVEALYTTALVAIHAVGQYQQRNIDEFFAVAYADFLAARYGRDSAPQPDAAGVVRGMGALFEELESAGLSPPAAPGRAGRGET